MTPEILNAFADAAKSNNWLAIMPELMLGCLALLLLVLEVVLPKNKHDIIPGVAIMGQLGVLIGLIINYRTPFLDPSLGAASNFNGLLAYTSHGQFMRVFFLLTSILVSALGTVALAKQRMPKVEFFHIVLVISAAMMLLAQSNHFVMLFVALETVTVGFYILVSYVRTNPLSLEAGLKYLIMGALSSSLLLFGIVLLYGAAGNPLLPGHTADSMNFDQLASFLAQNPDNFMAKLGIVLVISGVAFKIGAVPFQIWVPDVYQGAPTPVTAFLAVGSKAAGFAILMTLVQVFAPCKAIVIPLLALLAAATIIFGNLAALTQHNVKRLIGLSGVSHAGYLLMGVIASLSIPAASSAIYFYLVTYLLASFAVFGIMTHMAGTDDADQELEHYADLAKQHPFMATILAVGLGSLAGIPPLAGFIGKLLIFIGAFQAGLYWLLGVAIVGVVISIYYYFGWIKAAFFASWPANAAGETDLSARPPRTPLSVGIALLLAVLAFGSVLFGFYQKPVVAWLTAAL
jgi:NADH-quinone oxidoreductase subunit N